MGNTLLKEIVNQTLQKHQMQFIQLIQNGTKDRGRLVYKVKHQGMMDFQKNLIQQQTIYLLMIHSQVKLSRIRITKENLQFDQHCQNKEILCLLQRCRVRKRKYWRRQMIDQSINFHWKPKARKSPVMRVKPQFAKTYQSTLSHQKPKARKNRIMKAKLQSEKKRQSTLIQQRQKERKCQDMKENRKLTSYQNTLVQQ